MEISKLLKDVQSSARNYASLGLQFGSKAIGTTVAHLKTIEERLKVRAEALHSAPPAAPAHVVDSAVPAPKPAK